MDCRPLLAALLVVTACGTGVESEAPATTPTTTLLVSTTAPTGPASSATSTRTPTTVLSETAVPSIAASFLPAAVVAEGEVLGLSPDGGRLIVREALDDGLTGCENAPVGRVMTRALDGTDPRPAIDPGAVPGSRPGGGDGDQVGFGGGRAVIVETCEEFFTAIYAGTGAPDGAIADLEELTLDPRPESLQMLAVAPDGSAVLVRAGFSTETEPSVGIYDIDLSSGSMTMRTDGSAASAEFAPDGSVVVSDGSQTRLVDQAFALERTYPYGLADLSVDGDRLALAGGRRVALAGLGEEEAQLFTIPAGTIESVAIARSGSVAEDTASTLIAFGGDGPPAAVYEGVRIRSLLWAMDTLFFTDWSTDTPRVLAAAFDG